MTDSYAAEFEDVQSLRHAAVSVMSEGYERVEAFSPIPVDGLPDPLSRRPSSVTRAAGLAALAAGSVTYALQWWITVRAYPLDVGGRPLHSWPSFIPITFEMSVLAAALTAVFVTLREAGLPKWWRPQDAIEGFARAGEDRYWLWVEGVEHERARRLQAVLEATEPLRIVTVPHEEQP